MKRLIAIAMCGMLALGGAAEAQIYGTVPISGSTYTPIISYATPGDSTFVYTKQQGDFQIVGKQVCFSARLAFTPTFTTATGAIQVSMPPGLSAASSIDGFPMSVALGSVTLTVGYTSTFGFVSGGTSVANLVQQNPTGAVNMDTTNYTSGAGRNIYINGCYFTS